MGSTTYKEYRGYFEKDRALVRRFQKIDVNEPTVADTIKILAGLKSRYEEHHKIRFTNAALKTAVDLSARYINDRKLPDKAIDVIDEAAAAQNSYEDAGQSLERVDRLVGLIDDMDELKESVDLNTRVTAELAIALVAMWQLEAIQTVGDGTGGVIDAATIAEEQRFMEFTLPELSAD